jgi:hypothetical protein
MNFRIYILALFSCIWLGSCTTLINDIDADKLPKIESKLVVECYISPQADEIKVRVTESQPLFGPSDYQATTISNATVVLSGESGQITLPFSDSTKSYVIKAIRFKIEAGKKYTLRVNDDRRSVKASCTVPASAPRLKDFLLEPRNGSNYPGDSSVFVKASWEDIKGEPNYYVLRGYSTVEQGYVGHDPVMGGSVIERRPVKTIFNFSYEDFLYTDTNIDGITFNSPLFMVSLYYRNLPYTDNSGTVHVVPSNPVLKEVYFEVLNMDENYYKICKSLNAHSGSDNPFVEPALVYSNVEGGLGCFGAYNAGSLKVNP